MSSLLLSLGGLSAMMPTFGEANAPTPVQMSVVAPFCVLRNPGGWLLSGMLIERRSR